MRKKAWGWAVVAAGCMLLTAGCLLLPWWERQTPVPSSSSQVESVPVSLVSEPEPEPEPPKVEYYEYPTDQLFITNGRMEYQGGDLRLVIPVLSLDLPVENGVDEVSLNKGPGLYDYAQLPGWGNPNVSIAGHRDIHGSPFYYIDKLTDGDYLYLVWQEKVYIYTYQQTKIVKANDWSPIYSGEESLLTLTSCDPIGTSWNRIIVTGVLTDVVWEKNFDFPACKNHPEQREIWPRLE